MHLTTVNLVVVVVFLTWLLLILSKSKLIIYSKIAYKKIENRHTKTISKRFFIIESDLSQEHIATAYRRVQETLFTKLFMIHWIPHAVGQLKSMTPLEAFGLLTYFRLLTAESVVTTNGIKYGLNKLCYWV